MNAQNKCLYEFGSFQLDPAEHTLLHDGKIVSLTPKVFDTLLILIENKGHLVEKDELLEKVWSDTIVEEANLAKNISIIRKVLSEDGLEEPFIETIPKCGYRFIAPVKEISNSKSQPTEKSFKLKTFKDSRAKHGVILAILLVGVIGFGYWYFANEEKQIQSIAVMPFENVENNPNIEHLSYGINESIISKLSGIKSLKVLPRNMVKHFKGKVEKPLEIGSKLNVETILTGRISKNKNQLQIQTELIEVKSGKQLWRERYDRPLADLINVEDRIALEIASNLKLDLKEEEKGQLTKKHTENNEAYQFYLKGRLYGQSRTIEKLKQGETYYKQAIDIDPNFALAWAGLADLYWWQSQSSEVLENKEDYLRTRLNAERALQKALELAPDLIETRVSLGFLKFMNWEFESAENEFKKAIQIDPENFDARWRYCYLLRNLTRFDDALTQCEKAEKINPLAVGAHNFIADILFRTGRQDEAMAKIKEAMTLNPKYNGSRLRYATFLSKLGKHEEALAIAKDVIENSKDGERNPFFLQLLAKYHIRAGNKAEGRRILQKMLKGVEKGETSPARIANIYSDLGDKEKAFEWLEKSYEEKEFLMTFMLLGGENLRSDPRWADLVKRVGFPEQ